MNPLIRLVLALALGAAWFLITRSYRPTSQVNKDDPGGIERRREITGALRALAFFALVWFIASTVIIFGAGLVLAIIAPPNQRGLLDAFGDIVNSASGNAGLLSPLSLPGAVSTLLATVVAVGLAQRVARNQSILDLGIRWYKALPFDVALGLILGPLLFAAVFQIEKLAGYLLGTGGPVYNWLELARWFLVFLCIAISEELVVRGYFLQVINNVWGGTAAVVTTSVFWGFAHLLNPRATLLSVLNIIVIGLIFAYAYNITGRLWLPVAVHFSWNFAQGAIFGYPVSGYTVENSIFQPLVSGPTEFTGGLFGPEGGIVSLMAIVLGGLILYGWERTRPQPQPDK